MTVELLREAVIAIREDHPGRDEAEQDFCQAVADWLDKVATIREDAPTILGKAADVFTGYDDEAVARAYLSRSAS